MQNRGRSARALPLLVTACLVTALWALFVWTSNLHEYLVGSAGIAASLAFSWDLARRLGLRVEFRARDVLQAWRIPWYMFTGIGEITLVLLKDLLRIAPAKDLVRVSGFDSGRHDPVRVGRTTLAVAYTTTAPNFIVIGIDPTQSRMLFHQIQASSIPAMTRSLGAKG